MANVIAKTLGGQPQQVEVATIAELKTKLGLANYKATVNGESRPDSTQLQDGNFVTLSPNVKGGTPAFEGPQGLFNSPTPGGFRYYWNRYVVPFLKKVNLIKE